MKNSSLAIGALTVGLAVLGKQQHQIDIGGEIELTAAELSHGDDDQRLHRARGGARLAVAGRERLAGVLHRHPYGRVGEVGELGERLLDLGPTRQLAPGDPYHLATAPAPQGGEHVRIVTGACRRCARDVVARSGAVRQGVVARQIIQQPGVGDASLRDEVAGRENQRERVANRRWQ